MDGAPIFLKKRGLQVIPPLYSGFKSYPVQSSYPCVSSVGFLGSVFPSIPSRCSVIQCFLSRDLMKASLSPGWGAARTPAFVLAGFDRTTRFVLREPLVTSTRLTTIQSRCLFHWGPWKPVNAPGVSVGAILAQYHAGFVEDCHPGEPLVDVQSAYMRTLSSGFQFSFFFTCDHLVDVFE